MNKSLDLKLENRDTLDLKVCNVLRKAILQGDFEPGERLIQEELATSLGVSRMPVREALRKLETEGLIELVPHRGAVVKLLDIEDIKEIYELRSNLEEMAVSKSVEGLSVDDILELEQLTQLMKKSEGADEFVEANIEFHRILIKHCPWNRLVSFIETLWNGFPQQTPHMVPRQVEISNKEHDDILQAVKEKDSSKAGRLISGHIKRTGDALVVNLQEPKNKQDDLLHKINEN